MKDDIDKKEETGKVLVTKVFPPVQGFGVGERFKGH